jgi:glucose/mannose-6-phosphate isomerase
LTMFMSMRETILDFAQQFAYRPVIENPDKLKLSDNFVLLGMGGSHLAADLLKMKQPSLDLVVHNNYGLPELPDLDARLVIASSYSGKTEEVIEGLNEALKKKLNAAVIATGGQLIDLAKKHSLPYVQMPATGIQPRSALGYSLRGLMCLIGLKEDLRQTGKLVDMLNPSELEMAGKKLAKKINLRVPVIYAAARNQAMAYNWKIKFNETGKIPAFYNIWPELNHNEMTGFDARGATKKLSEIFHFIFLQDSDSNPKIIGRMMATQKILTDRGLAVEIIAFNGQKGWARICKSLILADWAAYYVAENYGLESEQVPMVEEFKQLIK